MPKLYQRFQSFAYYRAKTNVARHLCRVEMDKILLHEINIALQIIENNYARPDVTLGSKV
jgi:hypothetical protein